MLVVRGAPREIVRWLAHHALRHTELPFVGERCAGVDRGAVNKSPDDVYALPLAG
jgi:hypothetical protein